MIHGLGIEAVVQSSCRGTWGWWEANKSKGSTCAEMKMERGAGRGGGGGSNYVGNESGQIVLLSLMRWVKPLPRPRFPRLSDNRWLPTLRLSVLCFLPNKIGQRAGEKERRGGKGERGPPWSAVICLIQSFGCMLMVGMGPGVVWFIFPKPNEWL